MQIAKDSSRFFTGAKDVLAIVCSNTNNLLNEKRLT
jgi:hypothetical protein